MKIAFVVSGNGYGHLKRVGSVVDELFKIDVFAEVIVVGASAHSSMLDTWRYTERFRPYSFSFKDAHLQNSLKAILPGEYSFEAYVNSFRETRRILDDFKPDIVVSDNLAGILSDFPDSILMGSFLWSDTLQNKFPENSEIKKVCLYEDALLEKFSPRMIGIGDMVMPYVKQKTKFTGLPWFCEKFVGRKVQVEDRNILITGGGTHLAMERLLALANAIALLDDVKVNLDNALYTKADALLKSMVSRFDFTHSSFSSLDWIICRPGIGILTDSIRYEIPVCVLEEEDKEMQFNCDRVEQMGIGVQARNKAADVCDQLKLDTGAFRHALSQRKTGGAALAAYYILNS